MKRLRDITCARPRLLLVGINPSLRSAALGHHFAGPGNPFWRLLAAAKLVPVPLGFADDEIANHLDDLHGIAIGNSQIAETL